MLSNVRSPFYTIFYRCKFLSRDHTGLGQLIPYPFTLALETPPDPDLRGELKTLVGYGERGFLWEKIIPKLSLKLSQSAIP
jgi:hypothetical protein